jgi:YD repeat-containing protein
VPDNSKNNRDSQTVGYDNSDRRTLVTLPNSATEAYVYDKDSHVAGI